jgi:3',5'-cyclic-AMP phosphodiesterase
MPRSCQRADGWCQSDSQIDTAHGARGLCQALRMLIAQISDLHVAEPDAWVRQLVDSNANLSAAIDYLNSLKPRPDLVVATGDLTDNGTTEEYRLLRNIFEALEIPLYVIPGNHDEVEALVVGLDHHRYLPREGGALQYVVEGTPRIVAVDTTKPGYHEGLLGSERLSWLDETLSAEPAMPTMVMMHHPPFDSGIWWMDRSRLRDADRFEEVVRRHPQVRRVIAGHIHRAIQVSWGETLLTVAPSTAHQVGLELAPEAPPVLTAEPPMLTLLDWDGDRCASYLATFEADVLREGLSKEISNWSVAVEFLRSDPPIPKQRPGRGS